MFVRGYGKKEESRRGNCGTGCVVPVSLGWLYGQYSAHNTLYVGEEISSL